MKNSSTKSAKPRKSVIGFNDNRKKHGDRVELVHRNEVDFYEFDSNEIRDDEIKKNDQKMFKSKKLSKSKKTVVSLDFLIPRAKLAFNKLRQAFVKTQILH